MTVPTVWMNKKHNNTDHYSTDQKHCMQRKKQSNASCEVYAHTFAQVLQPVLSWSFPYQETPSEISSVTYANWAGELEELRSTSFGWIYFGDHLLETYSSTQQIVALLAAESEYISITKGAVHALEVDGGIWDDVQCGV